MKLSTLLWITAALFIGVYYFTNMAVAYMDAMYALQQARDSKAYSIMMDSR
jgi:hypothetical protein